MAQPEKEFKERLLRTSPSNTEQVRELTRFASQHHKTHAKQIAQELIYHIYQVSADVVVLATVTFDLPNLTSIFFDDID